MPQPNTSAKFFPTDKLIQIVRQGGTVKTGIDIFSRQGLLLLEGEVVVNQLQPLLRVKANGIDSLPFASGSGSGVWDRQGNSLPLLTRELPPAKPPPPAAKDPQPDPAMTSVERRLGEIRELQQQAEEKYGKAKSCIGRVLAEIAKSGGEFNFDDVSGTVTELFEFVTGNSSAFSFMTKEIFSYDDYLYNHSINVCTIGTVIIKRFNEHFNSVVNKYLAEIPFDYFEEDLRTDADSFQYFFPQELVDISIGYFMHDLGKVLIDRNILNKNGGLTDEEFATVKTHSWEKGMQVLEKNRIHNSMIQNIVQFHHCRLFSQEERCYPELHPQQVPIYVRACKLADIYDAMTSKRCYKDAHNAVGVVTEIFHKYEKKDRLLQFILHSFVKSIGIYPVGSVVTLLNGQLAYILDSTGPLVLPFTDTSRQPLARSADPLDLGAKELPDPLLKIDRRQVLLSPTATFALLPVHLKKSVQ
jgi:HD-GYP domain-containing protein (c-di-GMP phosphodiesterase class II)